MKLYTYLAALSAGAFAPCTANEADQHLPVPLSKPDDAFTVPQDFVGFGIESAYLNNYANVFSENLVSSLASRMKAPPILRIGGTSGDRFTVSLEQQETKVCDGGNCDDHQSSYILGRSFFDAYSGFQDAHMSIQAPLDKPLNMTNTLAYVWQAWNKLGSGSRVASIALGNEVEFIYDSGVSDYVDAAMTMQQGIMKNLSLSGDEARIFEAANTASGTVESSDTSPGVYAVKNILDAGINDDGVIAVAAAHYYQMGTDHQWTRDEMQSLMLNHTAITSRLQLYMPGIQASHDRGLDYAITEDAAVLGGAPPEFSGGFGYALWALDFNLAAMTLGVSRVSNLAGRPSAARVFWVPDDQGAPYSTEPQARAPFSAAMFLADFISDDGGAAVEGITVGGELTSAYAMYDNDSGRVRRVALLNMNFYNGTDGGERGSRPFRVPVPDGVESVTVRSLRADRGVGAMGFDYGGPQHNVTWAGEQWSHKVDDGKGHFPSGQTEETKIDVQDGIAELRVPHSEAVIVFIPDEA